MKILVRGSRSWSDYRTIIETLRPYKGPDPVTLIHGGARGADKLANKAAIELGFKPIPIYPNWEKFGRMAGVFRNQEMIDMDPDVVLAFWDGQSIGTADTIRRAAVAKIPTQVIRM